MVKANVAVVSSLVSMVGYDKKAKELTVEMNGNTYVYFNVPMKVAGGFIYSESKGGYFNKNIKNNYRCIKAIDATSSKFEGE